MVRTILLIGVIVVMTIMALIILVWLAVSIMTAHFENMD